MKWKNLTAAILCIIVIGSLGGCFSEKALEEETQENEQEDESGKIKIGVTFDSMEQERRETEQAVLEETVEKLGALVDIQSAEGDVETQKEQIRQFAENNVNVIIVTAVDCSALEEEIRDARNQGILVVSYERLIQGEQTDLFVGADSQMAGQQIAEEIKDQFPDGGSIMVVCGPENDQSSQNTTDTMEEELSDGEWEIIYRGNTSTWSQEDERKAVEEAFQNISDQADIVVCASDRMAGTAVEILENEEKTGQVAVIGQDADSDACKRIQEGTQTMTIYKPIEDLAEKAAKYAVQMAKGENLSEAILQENETAGEEKQLLVPCYKAETTAVTQKNVSKWGRNTF